MKTISILKCFRNDPYECKTLKFYCIFAFGGSIISAIFIWVGMKSIHAKSSVLIVVIIFAVMAVADVVLLIITAVKILQISKTAKSDDKWFQDEMERFWTYVQAFGVIILTCVFQLHSCTLYECFDSKIVLDFLKCFSAILIFAIFVLTKNTRRTLIKG